MLELLSSRSLQSQGGLACHCPLAPTSSLPRRCNTNCKPSFAPAPRLRPWSFAAASSCAPPNPTAPLISTSPPNSAVTATPSASGGSASLSRAYKACKPPHAPADPGLFPPQERLAVLTLASAKTEEHHCPATRWSLDELASRLVNEAATEAMHRSTIWRILHQADLKPHRSVYWLN